MNKFLKKIFYFSIPFLVIGIILAIIDPYNLLREEQNLRLKELKSQISGKINYPLYQIQDYYYHPAKIIFLGDSRTAKITKDLFEEVTNKQSFNLAYGGGTLQEIVETFWIAKELHPFEEVYIGLDFNLYNKFKNKTRVVEASKMRNSIFSYLFSKYCLKSSFFIIKSLLTNEKIEIEKPNMNKEEFWKYQLEVTAPFYLDQYKYPRNYYKDLLEISAYCSQQKIKLVIFLPPNHTDLQSKINEFKLNAKYLKFKNDLASLNVPVYDFNFPNYMTQNKDNFEDPFHYNADYAKIISGIISTDSSCIKSNQEIFKILSN